MNFRFYIPALTLSAVALITACGGGSDSDPSQATFDCSSNPVATVGVSLAQARTTFGSKVLRGQFNRSGVGPGGGAILTMIESGTGGSFGASPLIFTVSSVCTSSSFPNAYFVSGTWADNSTFMNVQFDAQTLAVRNFPLPVSWNGPNWYFISSGV